MRFISVDPSKTKTGITVWESGKPAYVQAVKEATPTQAKRCGRGKAVSVAIVVGGVSTPILMERRVFWEQLTLRSSGLVIEESMGKSPKSVSRLGEIRGYVDAACDYTNTLFQAVNTSDWRGVITKAYGPIYPANSDLAKALSKKLVREIYGWDLGDDEAESVLIGLWAYLTRTWDDPAFVLPTRAV